MAEGAQEAECKVTRDFIRHIANKVFAEALNKIPASVVSELRKRLGRLEDKFDFSVYGGKPERLSEALSSTEWRDIVDYAEKSNVLWVLRNILEEAAKAYRDQCPQLYEKIMSELELVVRREGGKAAAEEELTPEVVYRTLKYRGYKVTLANENEILVEESGITAKLTVENGRITYEICRKGKASTIEGLLIKIEKLREI